jgi:hypothetical protein
LQRLAAHHLFFDFDARRRTPLPPMAALGLRVARLLAERHPDRDMARVVIQREAAAALGLRSLRGWNDDERKAFADFAPLALLAGAAGWPAIERRTLLALIRAKAAEGEGDYAVQLSAHRRLCRSLLRQ